MFLFEFPLALISSHSHPQLSSEIVELCSLPHDGDVTSLGFLSVKNMDFIMSGSSNGSIYCCNVVKLESSLGLKAMVRAEAARKTIVIDFLTLMIVRIQVIPQWENVCIGSMTGMDVDAQSASIVVASEGGQVAWTNLDRPNDIRGLGSNIHIINVQYQ
jgi:hypothetical protein